MSIQFIKKEQFDQFLPKISGNWNCYLSDNEYCYSCEIENCSILIKSSIGKNNLSQFNGSIGIFVKYKEDFEWIKLTRIIRNYGWIERLQKTIDKIAKINVNSKYCPLCGQTLKIIKKNSKYYSQCFSKSKNCKKFKYIEIV